MARKSILAIPLAIALTCLASAQTMTVASGSNIYVRTDRAIDATADQSGTIYSARVSRAVMDSNGNVAIPKGSPAQLEVTRAGKDSKTAELGLRSVTVNGERYLISTNEDKQSSKDGLGKNQRTGKYVGGGALAGTVIGAIAGGAKGAVLGAIAGGAAGAGAQVLTRGTQVKVPAETELHFALQDNVQIVRDGTQPNNVMPASDQPRQ